MTDATTYETILTERRGRIGLITLNRPKGLWCVILAVDVGSVAGGAVR